MKKILVFLFALNSLAHADDSGRPHRGPSQACRVEFDKLCQSPKEIGFKEHGACLTENKAKFSANCQAEITKMQEHRQAKREHRPPPEDEKNAAASE